MNWIDYRIIKRGVESFIGASKDFDRKASAFKRTQTFQKHYWEVQKIKTHREMIEESNHTLAQGLFNGFLVLAVIVPVIVVVCVIAASLGG